MRRRRDNPEVLLPIDDMGEARLVLTDALIAEALRRSKHGDKPEEDAEPRRSADRQQNRTNTSSANAPNINSGHEGAEPGNDRRGTRRKGD